MLYVAAIHADVVALGEAEGIPISDTLGEEEDTLGDADVVSLVEAGGLGLRNARGEENVFCFNFPTMADQKSGPAHPLCPVARMLHIHIFMENDLVSAVCCLLLLFFI